LETSVNLIEDGGADAERLRSRRSATRRGRPSKAAIARIDPGSCRAVIGPVPSAA